MTKQQFKEEKEKLSKMSLKEKAGYIFSYYSTQLIIAFVAIFLLIQVVLVLYRFSKDDMLYCLFVNEMKATSSQATALEEDFRSYAGMTRSKQATVFDISIDLEDDSYADASLIKLTSLHSTGTIDVLITTQEIVERYKDQNFYLDLSKVLPQEVFERLSDQIYYAQNAQGDSIPVAIRLDDSYLSQMVDLESDSYLTITSMEHFPDTVLDFVTYCFQENP